MTFNDQCLLTDFDNRLYCYNFTLTLTLICMITTCGGSKVQTQISEPKCARIQRRITISKHNESYSEAVDSHSGTYICTCWPHVTRTCVRAHVVTCVRSHVPCPVSLNFDLKFIGWLWCATKVEDLHPRCTVVPRLRLFVPVSQPTTCSIIGWCTAEPGYDRAGRWRASTFDARESQWFRNIRRSNPSVDSSVFIHCECPLWQDPLAATKLMRFTFMVLLARLPHVLLLVLDVNIWLWVEESWSHMCTWEVHSQVS